MVSGRRCVTNIVEDLDAVEEASPNVKAEASAVSASAHDVTAAAPTAAASKAEAPRAPAPSKGNATVIGRRLLLALAESPLLAVLFSAFSLLDEAITPVYPATVLLILSHVDVVRWSAMRSMSSTERSRARW